MGKKERRGKERERERIDEHVPYTMGPRGKKTVVFAEKLTESNEYDEDEAIAKAPTAKATGQDAGKSSGKGEENRFKHFLDPIRSASLPPSESQHSDGRHALPLSLFPMSSPCGGGFVSALKLTGVRECVACGQGPGRQLERGHCERARAVPQRAGDD